MEFYIKGMEMPISCHACDMLELSGVVRCDHAYDTKNSDWGRALNCPLVPVPTHGRLIDADALPTYDKPIGKMMMFGGEYVYTQTAIDNAPTIIQASEEGE